MSGLFVSFEGVEGAGKTTQIKLLSDFFCERGYKFVVTREPGGTVIGELIRNIILDRNNSAMFPMTEALLYAAARCQLINEVITPALENDMVVICDRFLDSSLIYQGYARGLGISEIEKLNSFALCGVVPDVTFYLDLLPSVGLSRKKRDKSLSAFDRIENEDLFFHKRVYDGFNLMADLYPDRIRTINADRDLSLVHGEIVAFLKEWIS